MAQRTRNCNTANGGLSSGDFVTSSTPPKDYNIAKDPLPSAYYEYDDFYTFSVLKKDHGWMHMPRVQVATNNI